MTTVRIEKLTKRFEKFTAVDHIDLTIHAGELFFLLGPSGCGKTTLLRLIAGLVEPTKGKLYFNDRDVTTLGTDKRNTALCFQNYALWPHMSVRDNIKFGLDVRKIAADESKRRVDEAIALVQLEQHADKKPNALSGGQQQRVALARALVVRPDCLLLDEPLSNLDAKLRLEMRTEIRRICRASGLTAIYVTHDQKEALSIADRMAVLHHGKIEQIGKPQDLYLRPESKFVANFMGETNFLKGVVARQAGDGLVVATAIGEVAGFPAGSGPHTVGSNVVVSIRPESIQLTTQSPAGAVNRFDGMIHDTLYLGEVAQHQLTIGERANPKAQLRVFELNPKFTARDDSYQPAKLWFDPADVVILKD